MAGFHFPFTNLHELNLDWIVETVKTMATEWSDVKGTIQNTVLQWLDDNKQSLVSAPSVDGTTLDFTVQYCPFSDDDM